MSITPSSSASVTFHDPGSVMIATRSSGTTEWLALSHEVHQDRGEPGHSEVEAVVFGTPEELHAFVLRLVAAIEAEWPETASSPAFRGSDTLGPAS